MWVKESGIKSSNSFSGHGWSFNFQTYTKCEFCGQQFYGNIPYPHTCPQGDEFDEKSKAEFAISHLISLGYIILMPTEGGYEIAPKPKNSGDPT